VIIWFVTSGFSYRWSIVAMRLL